MDFNRKQENTLKTLLKKGAQTFLFERLGISDMHHEADEDILWQIFSSEVPIFEPRIYVDYCAQLSDWTPDYESVLSMRKSICHDKIHYLARFKDGVVPYSKPHFKMVQKAFMRNVTALRKQYDLKGRTFHVFEHEKIDQRYGLKISNLSSLLQASISSGMRKGVEPPYSAIERAGKSRYQKLHAFLDQLELMKDDVDLLMISPRTLSDMAMLLSQRLSRPVTIRDICPNLKVLCYCYDDSLPYRKVLSEFLDGEDIVCMSMFIHPTGMMESEHSLAQGAAVELCADLGFHYSFIHEKSLKNFTAPARRSEILRYDELEEGESYLIVLNSISGLLQYNSGKVLTLKDHDKLLFENKRTSDILDAKVSFLTENITNEALFKLNQSLESYGFSVREYMLGYNTQSRQVEWCLELNRSVEGVSDESLAHVSYLLHTELAFLSDVYKAYYKDHFAVQPKMIFIPLGTFSSLPERYNFSHLDSTEKNVMISSVCDMAWQKKIIECKAL